MFIIIVCYDLFSYLVFNLLSSTFISVILWQVIGRVEETSTYSWSRFCTVIDVLPVLPLEVRLGSKLLSKRWEMTYHCVTMVREASMTYYVENPTKEMNFLFYKSFN